VVDTERIALGAALGRVGDVRATDYVREQLRSQDEHVLIRAIEPSFNLGWMKMNRPVKHERELTSGPGKLCLALDIDRSLDGANVAEPTSDVIIAMNPQRTKFLLAHGSVVTTTRIGISSAAGHPLRFLLSGSRFVSRRAAIDQH